MQQRPFNHQRGIDNVANAWDADLIAGAKDDSVYRGRPIGIGVIGTGGIAQAVHLPAYKKLQDEGKVKIVALCDIKPDKLAEANAKFGPAQTYADYKELLANPDVDAVDVCTPNFMHLPPVAAAFAAGKACHLREAHCAQRDAGAGDGGRGAESPAKSFRSA